MLTNAFLPREGIYLGFGHGVDPKATAKRKRGNKIARQSRKIKGGGR